MWIVQFAIESRRAVRLAVLGLVLVCVCVPSVAGAHGSMLASEPSPLTTLDTAPPEVSVFFSGVILPEGSSLVVTGPDGQPIDAGNMRVDGAAMVVGLRGERPAGVYTVFWQINAADGHQDVGAFEFSAARATGGGQGGANRWIAPLTTVALLAGFAAAVYFIWRSVNRAGRPNPAPARKRR
jgi:methionine-rich copper-binding protein CopC